MQELRITSTNSANDSKGRAFGLEGNNFLYILISLMIGFGGYLVLTCFLGMKAVVALALTLPILLIPSAWVLLLKHNKPEGYAGDLFDSMTNREGWSFAPQNRPSNDCFKRS